MKQPTAVIFDWYNTLIDTSINIDRTTFYQVLDQMGYKNIDLDSIPNSTIPKYLITLLGKRWKEATILYENSLEKSQKSDNFMLNDGAIELLDTLKENNITMAIVSNKNGERLRSEIHHKNLTHYFDSIIGSGDTGTIKPSPEPVLAALTNINIEPSKEVFFIGDSISDIQSAIEAGCLPIKYGSTNIIKDILSFKNFYDIRNFICQLINI
ncbi:HAD hydrolase, IA, variant 1 family protein [Ehrlichia chaffeensis str. Heartland]|uniref:phosphoglycolate phosphatase n=2 Tax=Ehrlichia chaffeensis (strain ATCC CRL-10679 / Arkansas) TaxID=205920 RepID=Q2GHD1_EHRCR|nr:HAD-IA family hydrolase [Ehrlichia chaffeensis]ABD45298.1 HAD-superfamily hydrolase, subfamily IA, variant 1 [Ehrlichia chaffeensis str. Arkansas]AHX03447.1 HAD hydrolase, IA, variant 1 family protein [Ehrlichia chaffeensis str. Heartland]AHX05834.1 HAD hydrolase, IA, variant 1 family protein [Ehrlichia chaffeensis str. Jax]AHX06826.1 HAD hydrolase, IA, variant 1 family protein [Ehrlichia chaffeensis str. Liberty]AHX07341.1 HAD hydrolase, IA, variant 1 family protein [Ehrlichia chaffeensis 